MDNLTPEPAFDICKARIRSRGYMIAATAKAEAKIGPRVFSNVLDSGFVGVDAETDFEVNKIPLFLLFEKFCFKLLDF